MDKLRKLLVPLLLLLALSLPVLAGEEPAFDGYIVKLTDSAPRLLAAEERGLLLVETLEEAQSIPAEWVEYVEPNYIITLLEGVEGETLSDAYYEDQWWMPAIGASAAWNTGLTGAGVTVGFVDSGIRATHEDLNGANISGMNFYSRDNGTYTSESSGHGTFCAGIVAAQPDNGKGLAGLAPGVKIRMYRAFKGMEGYELDVANAIYRAADDGCQVLNLSFGIAQDLPTLREAVEYAAEKGVILVAAVGNDKVQTLMYPAAYDCVIGVGSVEPDLTRSAFSHYNESVFVTAPGGKMVGLGYTADDSYRMDAEAANNSGTSYATPVVVALAALALEADPDLTAAQFADLLKATAADQGDAGYDVYYGWGAVNIPAFVKALPNKLFQRKDGSFACFTQEKSVLLAVRYTAEGKLTQLDYLELDPGLHTLEHTPPEEGIFRLFLLKPGSLAPLCAHLIL